MKILHGAVGHKNYGNSLKNVCCGCYGLTEAQKGEAMPCGSTCKERGMPMLLRQCMSMVVFLVVWLVSLLGVSVFFAVEGSANDAGGADMLLEFDYLQK